jgi:hypothetical protein
MVRFVNHQVTSMNQDKGPPRQKLSRPVKMTGQTKALLWKCQDRQKSSCGNDRVDNSSPVKITSWTKALLWKLQDVQMPSCWNDRADKSSPVKMTGRTNALLWKWLGRQKHSCENYRADKSPPVKIVNMTFVNSCHKYNYASAFKRFRLFLSMVTSFKGMQSTCFTSCEI